MHKDFMQTYDIYDAFYFSDNRYTAGIFLHPSG